MTFAPQHGYGSGASHRGGQTFGNKLGKSSHFGSSPNDLVRQVWAENFEEEMLAIRECVAEFPFVAMDTEFPGVVARPMGTFLSSTDYHYQTLRTNVDLLKTIQVGLTFSDAHGNFPTRTPSTWQFNLSFDLKTDTFSDESLLVLEHAGIDFQRHEHHGVPPEEFGEQLFSSGLVCMERVQWLSFHSAYDFAYLLKMITGEPLPLTEEEFSRQIRLYFPRVYDTKYLMKSCKNLKGTLDEVAGMLDIKRVGHQHQSGSDSLLTSQTFFKMRLLFFDNSIDDTKFLGTLFGLGASGR
mmetsp:Transcript_32469/g.81366  ORF Transcript_32469/g.81366 Transcript_32469/m.81366 type:complete len:296 (-) Transcript_32469:135-1022(-)|eukprot:CAMPEP_0177629876 /NCGR_PEP_ID=MMETSP0447-20121125/904_1 /TAXON_ID=0 /ORGANISM="Stygamoeba regulata, Strain BSH-02190019" /LENGTH=295 /DNA_ID=CAMNT_0019131231 /DNA_START=82 /DNA_END=969 /DNA_ORIENTATION=+